MSLTDLCIVPGDPGSSSEGEEGYGKQGSGSNGGYLRNRSTYKTVVPSSATAVTHGVLVLNLVSFLDEL